MSSTVETATEIRPFHGLTNTGVSASRLYWEYKGGFFDAKGVTIPVAVTVFPGEQYQAPRKPSRPTQTSSTSTRSTEAGTSRRGRSRRSSRPSSGTRSRHCGKGGSHE
jgi:hypothetical protein